MLTNWKELKKLGVSWMELCEVAGINEWVRNEGLMNDYSEICITPEQFKELTK